jgi:HSP20 family protein
MTLACTNHGYWFDPFRDFGSRMKEWLPVVEENPTWAPPVDVIDKGDGVEIVADLPGIALDAITLSLDKGVLTLRAERKAPTPGERTSVCSERPYGVFERSFTVGEQLDPEKIDARYEAGVLRVSVAKKPQAQARRIEVKA